MDKVLEGKKVRVVGELRKILENFEDDEPIIGRIMYGEVTKGFLVPSVSGLETSKGLIIDICDQDQV